MKKILIISLKEQSATGICAAEIANELIKDGYNVDFITCKNNLKNNTSYNRIYIKDKLIRRLLNHFKDKNNKFLTIIFTYMWKLEILLFSLFFWPLNSFFFPIRLTKKIINLDKINDYDLIIPIYLEIDALLAANFLYQKRKKEYIPCFFDSLSGSPPPFLLTDNIKTKYGLKWEKKIVSDSIKSIMMKSSEKHQYKYAGNINYFKKIVFFDIPLIKKVDSNNHTNTNYSKKNNKIVCTYIGSLPTKIRDPYFGLNLLTTNKKLEINMVGPIPIEKKYIDFCQKNGINLIGSVSHEMVKDYINNSDILINFGNNNSKMVPSKIFEYMSYNKPIISFSPSAIDPSIDYLKKYKKSCIIISNENSIKNEKKINNFIDNLNNINKKEINIEKEFYFNTAKCYCDFITEIINNLENKEYKNERN